MSALRSRGLLVVLAAVVLLLQAAGTQASEPDGGHAHFWAPKNFPPDVKVVIKKDDDMGIDDTTFDAEPKKAFEYGVSQGKKKDMPNWIAKDITEVFDLWKLFRDADRETTDAVLANIASNSQEETYKKRYDLIVASCRRVCFDGVGWKEDDDLPGLAASFGNCDETLVYKEGANGNPLRVRDWDAIKKTENSEAYKCVNKMGSSELIYFYLGVLLGWLGTHAQQKTTIRNLVHDADLSLDLSVGVRVAKDVQARLTTPHLDFGFHKFLNTPYPIPPLYFVASERAATRFVSGNMRAMVAKWTKREWPQEQGKENCQTTKTGYAGFYECYSKHFDCYQRSSETSPSTYRNKIKKITKQGKSCNGALLLGAWLGANEGGLYGDETLNQQCEQREWTLFFKRFAFNCGGPLVPKGIDSPEGFKAQYGNLQWKRAGSTDSALAFMGPYQVHYGGWGEAPTKQAKPRWFLRFVVRPAYLEKYAEQARKTYVDESDAQLKRAMRRDLIGKFQNRDLAKDRFAEAHAKEFQVTPEAEAEAERRTPVIAHHVD